MRAKVKNHCKSCGKRIPSGLQKCLACSLNLKGRTTQTCKCLVCGSGIDIKDELCPTCGTNFLEEIEKEAGMKTHSKDEYICMICGNTVDKKARSCRICGTVFVEDKDMYSGPIVERVFNGRSTPNPG